MKSYSAEIEAQLAAKKLNRRRAIRFDLPSGSYGFITGYRGSLTVEGVLYVGSGGLIDIEDSDGKITGEADEVTVTLASHRRINGELVKLFDPHLLASIEDEVWFMRPAVVQRFWFGPGRQLEDIEQMQLRQIFSVEHLGGRDGKRIMARLMTPAAMAKVFEAKRNGPDLQKLIDPDDTSYADIIAAASETIYWGRKDPAATKTKSR